MAEVRPSNFDGFTWPIQVDDLQHMQGHGKVYNYAMLCVVCSHLVTRPGQGGKVVAEFDCLHDLYLLQGQLHPARGVTHLHSDEDEDCWSSTLVRQSTAPVTLVPFLLASTHPTAK